MARANDCGQSGAAMMASRCEGTSLERIGEMKAGPPSVCQPLCLRYCVSYPSFFFFFLLTLCQTSEDNDRLYTCLFFLGSASLIAVLACSVELPSRGTLPASSLYRQNPRQDGNDTPADPSFLPLVMADQLVLQPSQCGRLRTQGLGILKLDQRRGCRRSRHREKRRLRLSTRCLAATPIRQSRNAGCSAVQLRVVTKPCSSPGLDMEWNCGEVGRSRRRRRGTAAAAVQRKGQCRQTLL